LYNWLDLALVGRPQPNILEHVQVSPVVASTLNFSVGLDLNQSLLDFPDGELLVVFLVVGAGLRLKQNELDLLLLQNRPIQVNSVDQLLEFGLLVSFACSRLDTRVEHFDARVRLAHCVAGDLLCARLRHWVDLLLNLLENFFSLLHVVDHA
jgi:hypothetical protein